MVGLFAARLLVFSLWPFAKGDFGFQAKPTAKSQQLMAALLEEIRARI
jgi:hypothetical protein